MRGKRFVIVNVSTDLLLSPEPFSALPKIIPMNHKVRGTRRSREKERPASFQRQPAEVSMSLQSQLSLSQTAGSLTCRLTQFRTREF